eukprot:COSAG01_NODE_1775_length_9260_cov_58.468784_2_plen_143_part_00
MVAGPCCVFGATAPPANDSPVDAAAGRGAASGGSSSSDERSEEEQGGTDDEELPIAKIVSHRDTRGEPDDLNLAYYTVRFAGLEDFDEEMEGELPEEELLRARPSFCATTTAKFAAQLQLQLQQLQQGHQLGLIELRMTVQL